MTELVSICKFSGFCFTQNVFIYTNQDDGAAFAAITCTSKKKMAFLVSIQPKKHAETTATVFTILHMSTSPISNIVGPWDDDCRSVDEKEWLKNQKICVGGRCGNTRELLCCSRGHGHWSSDWDSTKYEKRELTWRLLISLRKSGLETRQQMMSVDVSPRKQSPSTLTSP